MKTTAPLEQPHFSPEFRAMQAGRVRPHQARGIAVCSACGAPGSTCCGACASKGLCVPGDDLDVAAIQRQLKALGAEMRSGQSRLASKLRSLRRRA